MTTELKLDEGLCRCCHAQGMFQNLSTPFVCQGQEEIFSEMLRDCFDIAIKPLEGEYSTSTYTICITCALKLRDASEFKKQVLECEERFKEVCKEVMKSLEPMDIDIKVEIEVPEAQSIKEEPSDDMDTGAEENYEIKFEEPKDEFDTTLKGTQKDDNKGKRRNLRVTSNKGKPAVKVKRQNRIGMPKRQKKSSNDSPNNETDSPKSKSATVTSSRKKIAEKKLVNKSYKKDCKKFILQVEEWSEGGVNANTKGKDFLCLKCLKSYPSEDKCVSHIETMHFAKFSCPICGHNFTLNANKKDHMAEKHGKQEIKTKIRVKIVDCVKKFQCDLCAEKFFTKRRLRRHMVQLHFEKECEHCGLNIESVAKMNAHLQEMHKVELPTCGICGYTNRRKSRIVYHQQQVHMKEKGVRCSRCPLRFYNDASLKRHMVAHNPVKKYECEFCHKKYARTATLSLHIKIHTGEKNKVCYICKEAFVQKASLNYHMMKRHPDAKY